MSESNETPFPAGAFDRQDESPDGDFYAYPRLVNHIDDFAIAAVGEAYRRFLPAGGDFLDLMTSHVSHFPSDMAVGSVAGMGMNMVELSNNPLLSERAIRDLNHDPTLPYESDRFDGAVICVSIQYLTRPVEVFAEIGRVLKPGAPLVIAFSNRCFPTKAVQAWQALDDEGHAQLIALYAREAGAFDPANAYDFSPRVTMHGVPQDPERRRRIATGEEYTDPLFVVVAKKKGGA